MEKFVTREDLKEAFSEFEERITLQHEKRIQMISGHYSDVLKSNQDLQARVCGANKEINQKIDTLLDQIQPILDAQRVVISLHAFLKWLGLPFTVVGLAVWWAWNKL
jgi:hypothetical protein